MSLTSIEFWGVLSAGLTGYWLTPRRFRSGLLALVSFGYLLTLAPGSILMLAAIASACFYLAPRTRGSGSRRGALLLALVATPLGLLLYFKYIPPLLQALAEGPSHGDVLIPLGISFYTFRLIHYVLEVSRGSIQDRSRQDFFCYVFLFPIFTAGPIERFDHFLKCRETRLTGEAMAVGLTRIAHGLVKKFAIAGILVPAVLGELEKTSALLTHLDSASPGRVLAFLGGKYVMAYLDFSAYSDIAIGCCRLFGIRILENFNLPVLAPNIADFWKRWHMTLAGWCQSYVYMPTLGRTRNPYLAVFATFLAIGVWHAGSLNWVAWGLYHAAGVSIYVTWNRLRRRKRWTLFESAFWTPAGVLLTFVFVAGGYAFTATYRCGSIRDALRLLARALAMDTG